MERLNHKLDITKLKTIKDVRNIFDTLELVASMSEDNEKYEMAKEYYTIPYEPQKIVFGNIPRKSLEEIQQELDEKFDKKIKRIQDKFAELKCNQEYYYNQRFNKIIENFEYARKNGKFPEKFTTLLCAGDSKYLTSSLVIKEGGKEVGFYTFGNGYLKYFMDEKPNFIVRFCMDKLLGFKWIDV